MKQNLIWRYEYKYRISRFVAEALTRLLPSLGVRSDPYADTKNGEYHVTSIYFDNPQRADYYDKVGGFKVRKKIRGRIYSPWQNEQTKEVRLEVKWRDGLHIAKEGLLLSHQEWEMLRGGRYSELLSLPLHQPHRETLSMILWNLIRHSMRPSMLVSYVRRPFIADGEKTFRLTLDRGITACEKSDFWYTRFVTQVLPPDEAVLEVKFIDVLPQWFQDLVRSFHLERISYSKYAASVDAVLEWKKLPR